MFAKMTKMKSITAELLINSYSRTARRATGRILQACQDHGIELNKINEISVPADIPKLTDQIKRRRPNLLIVAGGDGTVSFVAGKLSKTGIEIGIVPLGTTNNFARSLGLPDSINGAVQTIARSKAYLVDIGRINERRFANVTGVGISAEIAHKVTDEVKKRYGRLAYFVTGLKILMSHKPFRAVVSDKDNELQLNLETHQLIIANGRFHAGKEIAMDAKVDSRELIVFAIGGRSRLSLMWHLVDFYVGKKRSINHNSYLIAKDIKIKTSKRQKVELDGEVRLQTPLTASVEADAVLVRYEK